MNELVARLVSAFEDLSGRDVARKALIIARAMGRSLSPDDIELKL